VAQPFNDDDSYPHGVRTMFFISPLFILLLPFVVSELNRRVLDHALKVRSRTGSDSSVFGACGIPNTEAAPVISRALNANLARPGPQPVFKSSAPIAPCLL
jgi:hypothetical protein